MTSSFNEDAGFLQALDKVDIFLSIMHILPTCLFYKACGKFINSNAVTSGPKSTSRSPELLARYCDLLLKKR